jgi:hypothetical protein
LLVWLLLVSAATVHAGEFGIATIVEGSPLVLRGATWYKLVPGAMMEDGDIIEVGERAQVQLEFAAGRAAANLVGEGSLYLLAPRTGAKPSPLTFALPRGWLKVSVQSAAVRMRTTTAEIGVTEAILVLRTWGPELQVFIESGTARFIEFLPNGTVATLRSVKRGEFWSRQTDGPFAFQLVAPKTFVSAMPRHFVDPLPSLAGKFTPVPVLAVDHEVTYAEAEPWLTSWDRAAFERRFTSRLRDPAFRKAVEPHLARYPTWDRKLHPEKYARKRKPAASRPSMQGGTATPAVSDKEAP